MAYRETATMGGEPLEAVFRTMTHTMASLVRRIRSLEAVASNQTSPADTRFESSVDPATNTMTVFLRRVSTEEIIGVTGAPGAPGSPGADLTADQLAALTAIVLANLPAPVPGADGAPGAPGADGADGADGTAITSVDGGPP